MLTVEGVSSSRLEILSPKQSLIRERESWIIHQMNLSVEEFYSIEEDAKRQHIERGSFITCIRDKNFKIPEDIHVLPHEAFRHPLAKGLPYYFLLESASGYAIFTTRGINFVGNNYKAVMEYLNHFDEVVKLKAFYHFESADIAFEEFQAISVGNLTDRLAKFLNRTFPKLKGKSRFVLGVNSGALAGSICDQLGIGVASGVFIHEVIRGLRLHCGTLMRELKLGDLEKDRLALAHKYSQHALQKKESKKLSSSKKGGRKRKECHS